MAVRMRLTVFLGVAMYSLAVILMIEAVTTSEALVSLY
jgi:hypothetical protein